MEGLSESSDGRGMRPFLVKGRLHPTASASHFVPISSFSITKTVLKVSEKLGHIKDFSLWFRDKRFCGRIAKETENPSTKFIQY